MYAQVAFFPILSASLTSAIPVRDSGPASFVNNLFHLDQSVLRHSSEYLVKKTRGKCLTNVSLSVTANRIYGPEGYVAFYTTA